MTTVHIAGPPQMGGLYQVCIRCGHVLQDYTDGQPMVVDGEDTAIATWPEGQRIAIRGNATWVMSNTAELDDREAECRQAS